MDVQLLGAVVVSAEPGERSIDAPLARRCLAALALAPGSVTLDGLADALWGDGLPANWKQSLRNVVAKLRQRLEPIGGSSGAVIVTTPTGYRLAAGCTVDVHALLDVVNEAQEALARGDPDSALELANPAIGPLGRPLLTDVEADWLTGYRTRLEWARIRVLQVAAAASRDVDRAGQAVNFAAAAVALSPFDERSCRELMAAYVAAAIGRLPCGPTTPVAAPWPTISGSRPSGRRPTCASPSSAPSPIPFLASARPGRLSGGSGNWRHCATPSAPVLSCPSPVRAASASRASPPSSSPTPTTVSTVSAR